MTAQPKVAIRLNAARRLDAGSWALHGKRRNGFNSRRPAGCLTRRHGYALRA
jgi:hypothetical protein